MSWLAPPAQSSCRLPRLFARERAELDADKQKFYEAKSSFEKHAIDVAHRSKILDEQERPYRIASGRIVQHCSRPAAELTEDAMTTAIDDADVNVLRRLTPEAVAEFQRWWRTECDGREEKLHSVEARLKQERCELARKAHSAGNLKADLEAKCRC